MLFRSSAEGFGDEQIDEACLFLLGACSCEVKRMNPGWDLLLNANWNESLQAIGFPELPPAEMQKTPVAAEEPKDTKPPEKKSAPLNSEAQPETVTIAAAQPSPDAARKFSIPPAAVAAGVLLVLGSALALRTLRRKT